MRKHHFEAHRCISTGFSVALSVFLLVLFAAANAGWAAPGDNLWSDEFGLSKIGSVDGPVMALAVDADGNVYVGGEFTNHVAQWAGSRWVAPLGNGLNDTVRAFEVNDTYYRMIAGGDLTWPASPMAACGGGGGTATGAFHIGIFAGCWLGVGWWPPDGAVHAPAMDGSLLR